MYKVQGGKTRKENNHIQLCYSCRVKYFACLLAIFGIFSVVLKVQLEQRIQGLSGFIQCLTLYQEII